MEEPRVHFFDMDGNEISDPSPSLWLVWASGGLLRLPRTLSDWRAWIRWHLTKMPRALIILLLAMIEICAQWVLDRVQWLGEKVVE